MGFGCEVVRFHDTGGTFVGSCHERENTEPYLSSRSSVIVKTRTRSLWSVSLFLSVAMD